MGGRGRLWEVPFTEIADLLHARTTGAGKTWGEAQARRNRVASCIPRCIVCSIHVCLLLLRVNRTMAAA